MDIKLVTIEFAGVDAEGIKLDAAEITVPEDQVERAKVLVQSLYDSADTIDRLNGERDALEAEVETLREQDELSPQRLDEAVKERASIVTVAEHVGLKADSLADDTNEDIVRKVVATRVTLDEDASQEYVDGCFNIIKVDAVKQGEKSRKARTAHSNLAANTAPHRDAKGGDTHLDGEQEQSYRERAEGRLQGIHNKTDEEMRKEGMLN